MIAITGLSDWIMLKSMANNNWLAKAKCMGSRLTNQSTGSGSKMKPVKPNLNQVNGQHLSSSNA